MMIDGPLLYNTEGSLFDQIEAFLYFNTWERIIWCDRESPILKFPRAEDLEKLYSVGCGQFWRFSSRQANPEAHCKETIDTHEKARIFQKAAEGKIIVLVLNL